jgi:predicted MFS family arabinose efflux permease
MAQYLKVVRSFSPSVRYYILALGAVGFAFFGVASVVNNLYLLRLGFSQELIGQVTGVGMLAWAAAALPASFLGRRLGLRHVVVAGVLIIATGYALLLLVNRLPETWKVTWLFGTSILVWSGAALTTVNGLPLLASASHPDERRHAFAVANAVSAISAILGSLVAGFIPGWIANLTATTLQQPSPYQAAFWLVPVFFVVAAIFYSRITPREQEEIPETEHQAAGKVPLSIFLFFGVVVFFMTASEGGIRAFFNMYLDSDLGASTAQIGSLFAFAGILPIVGSLVMPLLAARFGLAATLGLTSLFMAASLVFMGRFNILLAASLSFITYNFLSALGGTTRGILSQEIVAPRWRGATSAILILGMALGWASMALVGSAVIGLVGFSGLMYLSAASALVSAMLIAGYLYLKRPKPAATDAPKEDLLGESELAEPDLTAKA